MNWFEKIKKYYDAGLWTKKMVGNAVANSQLVAKVEELETSNTALAAQVDYISMMTDTDTGVE